VLAVVCPGQGSQSPGFLTPWLDLPGVRGRLEEFSEVSGVDLTTHGTTSDAPTIRDTSVAQPLIVSASLIALRAVLDGRETVDVVGVTAGHSVGELTAAAVAGVLDDTAAVALVSERARAMASAAALHPTGMSAVLGGDPTEVLAAIADAGLYPANVNSAGQVVAAGDIDGLAALAADPPARARVIPLEVAGAFHTPFMEPARLAFGAVAATWTAAPPVLPLLSDADGAAYTAPGTRHGTGRDVLERLIGQVVQPVRWDLCQATLAALGVTAMIELLPAGVLTGLARRTLPGVETVAVTSPGDLAAARDLIRRHGPSADAGTGVPAKEAQA
jgi:[acyl-carrier-protein] S-malonyltransferase